MDIRAHQILGDIRSTRGFGHAMLDPSSHFCRVFALFSANDRRRILDEAFRQFKSISPGEYYLEQFVAYALFGIFGLNESFRSNPFPENAELSHYIDNEYREVIYKWNGDPKRVKLASLPNPQDKRWVQETCSGDSHVGLAGVLSATVFPEGYDDAQELDVRFVKLFHDALGQRILNPEQAAAVASCTNHSQILADAFLMDADIVLADAQTYRVANKYDHEWMRSEARALDELYKDFGPSLAPIFAAQKDVVKPLSRHFGFEETPTGLLIPAARRLQIATSLAQVVAAAEQDRQVLLNMDPRDFERFMKELFESLGFEVQLTQATRDGGADLLCLHNSHGIPFSLAVEVKRYAEHRPITVELVRAFIGANRKFRANRLMFVTTSSYTKPARDYAENFAAHDLTLRQYEHIQEWCRHYLLRPNRLIY